MSGIDVKQTLRIEAVYVALGRRGTVGRTQLRECKARQGKVWRATRLRVWPGDQLPARAQAATCHS